MEEISEKLPEKFPKEQPYELLQNCPLKKILEAIGQILSQKHVETYFVGVDKEISDNFLLNFYNFHKEIYVGIFNKYAEEVSEEILKDLREKIPKKLFFEDHAKEIFE